MKENPHKDFSYSETAKQLKKLLLQLCTVKVKKKIEDVKYKGEEIKSCSILATSFTISKSFTEEQLKHDKEQGRDALDVFINKVFQLGFSVGYEHSIENHSFMISFAQEQLDKMKLERLETEKLKPEVLDRVKEIWKNCNEENEN
jgi:hypothetical protein